MEHFAPYIRQSIHPVTHHPDNRSSVQAWNRARKGAYSNSSRMGAFLTGLSAMSVEMVYTPGKELFTSDHASRHPVECKEEQVIRKHPMPKQDLIIEMLVQQRSNQHNDGRFIGKVWR